MATAKYKRILLKLSGESLQGKQNYGHDVEVLNAYAQEIKQIKALGVEIGIVIGGGNIFRGKYCEELSIERSSGDYMGMVATIFNSLAFKAFKSCAQISSVTPDLPIWNIVSSFIARPFK